MISAAQSSSGAAAMSPATSMPSTPELQMLVMMVQNQLVQGDIAKDSINISQEKLKELREQVREAIAKAREAEEDGGLFGKIGDVLNGDIATLAQLVVVAAAAAVTGGAAAIVLASIAVACTLASKYGDELGIPPKVCIGLGIAAAVATVASGNVGGVATASGSAATTAGAAAGNLVPGAAAGASIASGGAAATAAAAANVTQFTQAMQEVGFYAKVVGTTASGTGAGAHIVAARYQSDAINHDADAKSAQSHETLENMSIDSAIDLFERTIDRQLSLTSQSEQMLESNQRATQLIIQGVA